LPADDARNTGFQDPGLLAGNCPERVAEEGDMVDGDRRDGGRQRLLDDIGGVEPPAKPGLQEQQIRRGLREGEECCRRGDLEMGYELAVIGGFGAGKAVNQLRLADRRAAFRAGQHDAFVEIDEMRRGIDVHALAERLGGGA
jgi:hypothetical protein